MVVQTPRTIKIISWHGRTISPQTGKIFLDAVMQTEGPVAIPLRDVEVAKLKAMAGEPESQIVKEICASYEKHPAIFKLGLLALLAGKEISPIFTGVMMKRGTNEFREKTAIALNPQANRDVSRHIMREATADFEAERMLTVFERFRQNRPALIIAEDNQAIELGRLFRAKVTKATAHSPHTKIIVRRAMQGFQRIARKRM